MAAPTLRLDDTMELLSRVLGAGDDYPVLNALSAALKGKTGALRFEEAPPCHVSWCGTVDKGCEKLQRHLQLSYGHLS